MKADLRSKDLELVLELAYEAQGCQRLESFCYDFLPQLRRLVPADSIGYNEVDLKNGTVVGDTDPPEIHFAGLEEALINHIQEHPLAGLQARGELRPRRISDFLTVGQFHRLGLYHEVYRRLGTEDQIAFGLPGEVMVAIAINRSSRTFTERDLHVLELLRPHLSQTYVNLIEYDRTAALVNALETGLERHDAAVIQVDRLGRAVHASAGANELMTSYCGAGARPHLPPPLMAWLRTRSRTLLIEGLRGRLRVQLLDVADGDWRPLLLREEGTSPPTLEALQELGLSPRQAQVLRLLASGKRNDEIARALQISSGTVRKHLEHIYDRLGVTSRAQAIARVLS